MKNNGHMQKNPGKSSTIISASYLVLVGIALASLTTLAGIKFSIFPLKIASAVMQVGLLFFSINNIFKNLHKIKWTTLGIFVLILSLYPIGRILTYSFLNFDFKKTTDSVIIIGSYYLLPIHSLSILLTLGKVSIYQNIRLYSVLAFPLAIIGSIVIYLSRSEASIDWGHRLFDNMLIPCALLAVQGKEKKYTLIGIFSALVILVLSSLLWSRSYTLVGIYLLLVSFVFLLTRKNWILGLSVIIISTSTYFIVSSLSTTSLIRESSSISEKFQFDTLSDSLSQSISTGSLLPVFYWEGNSRASILEDAFRNFSMYNWLFGKGHDATYYSFIERSTIEIGWAQELFRWGLIYTVSMIIIFLGSILKLAFQHPKSITAKLYLSIVMVKFLDSFVLGLPNATVYSCLVFCGILYSILNINQYTSKNEP